MLTSWTRVACQAKALVSVQLGRTAFSATQLICSDFLAALSTAVLPSLIELLYRFATQGEDLNISLTTVTMIWNVSDFVLGSVSEDELDPVSIRVKEADDCEEEILAMVRTSSGAQWLLLLLRVQEIVNNSHKEVRKAAFQTLCSIFKNNGHQLSPSTWDLALRSIVLRIAFSDSFLYYADAGGEPAAGHITTVKDEAISIAIISGTADVLSQHLSLIEQVRQLPSLWEAFLSRLEAYLDLERHALSAAVYTALTRVLARIGTDFKTWTAPMYRTLHLWLIFR